MDFNLAKEITLANKQLWDDSEYPEFLKFASKDEFLKSQIPFYHAVSAFSLFLLKLASMIPSSQERLLIVENIWEEHGKGDANKFHTSTFKQHLKALGWDGQDIFKNPFVTMWIDGVQRTSCAGRLFNKLAAIEYMYALISQTISGALQGHEMVCEQSHYSKHSELDWEHGKELLEAMCASGYEFDRDLFQETQLEFINLFNRMVVPTKAEMEQLVRNEPVAFYYTRECQHVIEQALAGNKSKGLDVFTICSGGEHVLHYLNRKNISSITAFDVNPHQLDVCRNKILHFADGTQLENKTGKFEYLFEKVRAYFTSHHGDNNIMEIIKDYPSTLEYVISKVFDDKMLEIVFTEEATKYSSDNFAQHFLHVYRNMIQGLMFYGGYEKAHPNTLNIIYGAPVEQLRAKEFGNITSVEEALSKVSFIESEAGDLAFKAKFDVIDLSNIGDWMPQERFLGIVRNAYRSLKEGGVLILRRLLGDYSLSAIGEEFDGADISTDDTGFYSEVVFYYNEI